MTNNINHLSLMLGALAAVHSGAVVFASLLIVLYLNDQYSGSFWSRLYYMELIPVFIICLTLLLSGLGGLLFSKFDNAPQTHKSE